MMNGSRGDFGRPAFRRLLLGTTAATLAFGMMEAAPVLAQDAGADTPASASRLEEISVTGTRVKRTGFDTPNPVTVLDQEYMENLGLVNISDVIAQIPQNQPYVTPTNIGLGNFNVGASLANLRGLNPYYGTRTLVLVDGHRHVPSTNGGAVDLNLIPSLLVSRTETVTGGASAAYGTDAVAGVVNLILDKELDGIKAQVDYGQTFRSDGSDFHAAFAGGSGYGGGRGHFVLGGEYEDSGEIDDCAKARLWCAESWDDITNPGYNNPASPTYGEPNFVIAPNSRSDNQSFTGVFPGLGKQFNADGTALMDYEFGKYNSPNNFLPFQGASGGDGPSVYSSLKLKVPVERYSLFGHTDYEVSDNLNVFAEASYGKRSSVNVGWAFGPGVQFINPDNAYLPADVAAMIAASPGPDRFNRSLVDHIRQTNHTKNETYRLAFGADGTITGSWTWDAYYQYGHNSQSQRLENNKVNTFFNWSLDAVFPYNVAGDPASGLNTSADPVCRVARDGVDPANPLASYAADCVPINLFGTDNITQEAIDYTHRTLMEDFGYTQHVAAANVQGNLFEGIGAGPIGLAAGAEYRRDTGNVTHGDQPFYDQFALSYQLDFAGKQETLEGYSELNVPLLRDLPLANYLEVNGAIRQTHTKSTNKLDGNSQSQNITTWKLSGVYNPISWLRLRATRSRDIRVAGFRELYIRQSLNPGEGLGGTVINRWTDNPADVTASLGGGNVGLQPEKANTWTLGLVLQPEDVISGLRFSADWYEIELNDAINSNVGNQTVVDLCWQYGQYCNRIEGTSDGAGGFSDITYIDNTAANYAQIAVRGVDFELDYQFGLDRFNADWDGALNLRGIAAYLYDFVVDSGASSQDYAGQSGPLGAFVDYNPAPYWILNGWLTYTNNPFTFTVQTRYIGSGAYRRDWTGPQDEGYDPTQPNSVNDNRVPARVYLNLSASYAIEFGNDRQVEIFGSIQNLFDTDPPIAPGGNGGATNPVYFDVAGAAFRTGLRFRY